MPERTYGLSIKGELSLAESAKALSSFSDLLDAIAHEEGPDNTVAWRPEALSVGSIDISAKGASDSLDLLDRIDQQYLDVGTSIGSPNGREFSAPVTRAAQALLDINRSNRVSIRFSSQSGMVTVGDLSLWPAEEPKVPPTFSEGSVEGVVETASIHDGFWFTLFDSLNGLAVRCYYSKSLQEQVRSVWGKRAVISGVIQREALSGRPLAIRDIEIAELIEDTPAGAYRRARGVVPRSAAASQPEVAIRRARNAD